VQDYENVTSRLQRRDWGISKTCLPVTLSMNRRTGIVFKDSSRLISHCYSARPAWSISFLFPSLLGGAKSIFLQSLKTFHCSLYHHLRSHCDCLLRANEVLLPFDIERNHSDAEGWLKDLGRKFHQVLNRPSRSSKAELGHRLVRTMGANNLLERAL